MTHHAIGWRWSAKTTLVVGLCIVCAGATAGCATSNDVQSLKTQLEELKKGQAELKQAQSDLKTVADLTSTNAANTPSPINYELLDVARQKTVGWVRSDVHITVGERVFLKDDIWDVKFVKIFTSPTDGTNQDPPRYHTSSVQLLVSFGGKATEPKKKE